jgi:hypothetical protein
VLRVFINWLLGVVFREDACLVLDRQVAFNLNI